MKSLPVSDYDNGQGGRLSSSERLLRTTVCRLMIRLVRTRLPGPTVTVRVVDQRVHTDFNAQNLELNIIRFPMCNTGCSSATAVVAAATPAVATRVATAAAMPTAASGFSMYGSCGVRYFHVDDDFLYGTRIPATGGACVDDKTDANQYVDLRHQRQEQPRWSASRLDQRLLLRQVEPVLQQHVRHLRQPHDRMATHVDRAAALVTYQDGSNVRCPHAQRRRSPSSANCVSVRAYDINCHWRGVIAYRAVAITGVATASDQLSNLIHRSGYRRASSTPTTP